MRGTNAEFFHALIQNSSDIVTILSMDGTVLYESPSVDRVLGYAQDELLGRNVFELVHSDDRARALAAFTEIVKRRDLTLSAEFSFLHKDGSWRVLDATGSNQLDNPLIAGIVVNSRDVTERKIIEEKLRQSEERFRRIFEDGPLGMIIVDPDYRLLKANKAFCKMLGYAEQELTGRSMEEFTHPEDWEKSETLSQRALTGVNPLFQLEKRYLRKSRESVWATLTATTVPDQEGKILYALGMIEDISARKAAEREKEELIIQLTDALAKIKTLRGLIPICAWCKKIRDDRGYWTRVETYIREHSDATFTHCICPTCLKKEDPATYADVFGNGHGAGNSKSKKEERAEERLRLKKPVACTFQLNSGNAGTVVLNAVLEDLSDAGMCLSITYPLTQNTVLFSDGSADHRLGVVRWCAPAETGSYRVGIEFLHD